MSKRIRLSLSSSQSQGSNRIGKLDKNTVNCDSGQNWIINFRSVHKSRHGITSPTFVANNRQWNLALSETNDPWKKDQYVSVYVQLSNVTTSSTPFDAYIWLCLVDTKNRKVNKKLSIKNHCFIDEKSSAGFSEFITCNQVLDKKNNLLHDNINLIINCSITVTAEYKLNTNECKILMPFLEESTIKASINMEELLKDERFSDVTLVSSDGVEFRAHKAILSTRSPYFEAMFSNQMREQAENSVVMQDLTGKELEQILLHIYACRVREFESMTRDLFIAADKYSLEDLNKCCEEHLCKKIELENVINLLIFADTYNAEILKAETTRFFIQNAKEVVKTKDFDIATNTHPSVIANLFRKMV